MDIVVLIGRILFSALFLYAALGHLTQTAMMAGYAGSRGVPAPKVSVLVTGVMLLVGGLSVLLGAWADIGALVLVAFLAPTALLMHGFWRETDAQARQTEMAQFFKDLSLAGAALMLFAFFAVSDVGLTLTDPLIKLG
jgi:Predicted membrane protein